MKKREQNEPEPDKREGGGQSITKSLNETDDGIIKRNTATKYLRVFRGSVVRIGWCCWPETSSIHHSNGKNDKSGENY